MSRGICSFVVALVLSIVWAAAPALAQPLQKSAVSVDPGNKKQTGQTFGYRLTYNCSNTSGPCLNAEVDDLLPAEVQLVSTVPTGDVAATNVTNNYMGSGRTRVQFVLINPLPAGNSGDLLINVRFPNGSTPDGTVATNTADGINLGATPGTFTTPPVSVTAVTPAVPFQVTLSKLLLTPPANLDMPESYRLRISVSSNTANMGLTAVGPVTDTLPPGTVFNSATPAADCEPGCDGTTPATITWTSPCSLPVPAGGNCDIQVNVTFPSTAFPSGTSVTNSFTATGTPTGQSPQNLGTGQSTDTVTTFVPNPRPSLSKGIDGGSPNPPTLNQTFTYDLNVGNTGNVPLDNTVVVDTLPVQLQLASVTTGSYSGFANFAAGEGVRVSYEKNTAPGVFTLWGSSPNSTTNTTLTSPPPGLGAGEYVTKVRWEYGSSQPGAGTGLQPQITGKIVNPDNAGNPVAFGNTIQNCADLSAVYTAGPTNVTRNSCNTFTLSGPFVQLAPAKTNLSGGPFNPGQTVSWSLAVRSDPRSSDPAPLDGLVAADLLPVDLVFVSWSFDDQGTGLPAPQVFEQIPNFQGSGRTLLRWHWNAGSGSLGINQQVLVNVMTTVRNGATFGSLSNTFDLASNNPGLVQRCTGGSATDTRDLDNDGSTTDTLCTASGTITISAVAQLISNKQVKAICDPAFTSTSAGTLIGGDLTYRLHVQNVGTEAMQNLVLIDILPFVGDTGVRDTSPRGSQWTPLLAAPILPPAGTTLYYSTSGNPCRGEVGGPTTSCDPPNWTTVPPDPITAVRSFKVDFGSRVVGPFDTLEFTFHLTAPGNIPAGALAYNSFAYQGNRADGLGSLAAEPQKVGVTTGTCDAASLGDFVWVDTNKDGIQNDGPTGLNNLYVRLFTPGADGVSGTPDDLLLATAATSQSPGNTAGWYNFPGLAPGTYYVCVTAPPTFVFTTPHVGSGATDSDANPNGCSAPVTLVANQHDPDVDFGLVATQLAALGDYVWFDRNADGLQTESVWDGANGVTVKLFVDNGNGTAEPGVDALVATTVTANDVYGRPGYYRFDGLVPGLPYFVQFMRPAAATGFTTLHAGDPAQDSDANLATGVSPIVTLSPGEFNPTLDAGLLVATGNLALGNQVWLDGDNDGLFAPQSGEAGIDNVRLDLYLDANHDGRPTLDEHQGTTFTATSGGFAGRYLFGNLAPGDYIVVVDPSNFAGNGPLAGLVSSTGNDPAPDPDNDVDGDDNGTALGAVIGNLPVTLTSNGEPTSEDGNNNTNLTVDFGFTPGAAAPAPPQYDYGDAPDVAVGTTQGDYNTSVLDNGAFHLLGVPNAPYLGACVDADSGFNQNPQATGDDATGSAFTVGTCAVPGDDEDGVTFTGPFVPGSPASFTVTAGGPTACTLNAWVDWNRDGIFGNSPGEQIATDLTVPTGPPTTLTPTVPAGAVPGLTYARFRCSSATGLGPTGPAPDGEVEDYVLGVVGSDFGDDPATYGTQGAGAASHRVDFTNPLMLGRCVDTETDGQPNATASGDDNAAGTSRVGTCFNDEDGVTFTSPITACTTASVGVFVTLPVGATSAKLDAWLDWNRDGDFGDASEQIFTSQTVVAGTNSLTFPVPCTAAAGLSYARFRLSTAGGLGSTGAAPDGEVEDYAVVLGTVDFGDAPDSYGTSLAQNGPYHRVTAGFSLGATEDSEPDGQPSVGATGDGADEDGVTLPAGFTACGTTSITVNLTNTAGIATPKLDAWIDWDGDGVFNDPRDRIASGLALVSGANTLPVSVPCNAKSVHSYARFRLSSTGVAGPGGAVADGEVEDYAVTVMGLDFGDAPDPSYPTLLASNGARHAVLPTGNPTLGTLVDTEPDGQPNATASGDDANTTDDEDGVTFPATLIPGANGSIQLRAGATGGIVSCWIDFNRNGSWADAGDQVVTNFTLAAGATVTRTFPVPVGSPQGNTVARCRISSVSGLGVTGLAADGEVEDHLAPIGVEQPKIGIAKRVVSVDRDPADPLAFNVTLAVRLTNYGNVPLSSVNATANFASVFTAPASFTVTAVTSADFAVNPSFDGGGNPDLLAAGNTLAIGQTGVIQIVLHVNSGGKVGPYTASCTARGTSPAGRPVTDVSQDGDDPDPDGNGDPTDNTVPTVIELPVSVTQIPTLSTWGLLALAGLLGLFAVRRLGRRAEE